MRILSVRQEIEWAERATVYIRGKWASEQSKPVYDDCIAHCLQAKAPLPQWYLLLTEQDAIAGCAGLITNDFISRMDLYPWICSLFVEPEYRGHAYGQTLLAQAERDARAAGFESVYLCTAHTSYYERYGYAYIGTGYHPWGESSRIYAKEL